MKYCVNCKAELQDEAQFCGTCGTKQVLEENVPVGRLQEEKKRKKVREKKRRKGKYFVVAGIAVGGIVAVFFGVLYLKGIKEKEALSKLLVERNIDNLENDYPSYVSFYPKGMDYYVWGEFSEKERKEKVFPIGLYSRDILKYEKMVFDESNYIYELPNAEYDGKGRLIAYSDDIISGGVEYQYKVNCSYSEKNDGGLTITYIGEAEMLVNGSSWSKSNRMEKYEIDSNGELVSKKVYSLESKSNWEWGSTSEAEWVEVKDDARTYETLLKDGEYKDSNGWWENEDGSKIWVTEGIEKKDILWYAEADENENLNLFYNCMGKYVKITTIENIEAKYIGRSAKSQLKELLDNHIGYDKEGRPRILWLENDNGINPEISNSDDNMFVLKYIDNGRIGRIQNEWLVTAHYYMFYKFGKWTEIQVNKIVWDEYLEIHNLSNKKD